MIKWIIGVALRFFAKNLTSLNYIFQTFITLPTSVVDRNKAQFAILFHIPIYYVDII